MKLKEKISQFYKKHTKAFNIIENILIVFLVLVAYALGFSNGVKECSNNQNNSQIEEKHVKRRNENINVSNITNSISLNNVVVNAVSSQNYATDILVESLTSNSITIEFEFDSTLLPSIMV